MPTTNKLNTYSHRVRHNVVRFLILNCVKEDRKLSIWTHSDCSSADSIDVPDLSFFNAPVPRCQYCDSPMAGYDILDYWQQSHNDYALDHAKLVDFYWMNEEQGVPLENLELSESDPGNDVICRVLICSGCGWWTIEKRVLLSAKA